MICVLCKKRDVRPPACCHKCGRLVCKECRREQYQPQKGFKDKGPLESVLICKFCIAELELST
jgi:hypothetical protein